MVAKSFSFISRFCTRLQELRAACSGNVAVIFALATIPVMGAAGAAVDYSNANSVKTAMQSAADAAALASIRNASSLSSNQLQTYAANFFNASFNKPQASNVQVAATYDSTSGIVTISASGAVATSIMGIIGVSQINISGVSKAALGAPKPWPVCVLVTDPDSNHTLIVMNGAKIDFTNCMVQVNTDNWDAVEGRNSAYIHSTNGDNCLVGDIHYGDITPPKDPTCTLLPDPFSGYAMPTSAATCDHTNLNVTGSTTINPGTYCGNTTLNGTNITLSPGVYIVQSGNFTITGNTVVTATNVTFLLTGTGPNFYVNNNAKLNITPTTSGTFAGFVFYLDNNSNMSACDSISDGARLSVGKQTGDCINSIDNNAQVTMSGIIYLRNSVLLIDNNAQLTVNPGSLVADFIVGTNNAVVSLTGTLNTSTAAQQAMQKSVAKGTTPTLVQ